MRQLRSDRIRIKKPNGDGGNCVVFTAGVVMLLAGCCLVILTHPEVVLVGEFRRALILRLLPLDQSFQNSKAATPGISLTHPIPKLIHYAFDSELIPLGFASAVNSCLTRNPNWTFHLWTKADLLLLLRHSRPDLLRLYETLGSQGERSSMAKFPVLYSLGGVFLEPDVHCLRPLDSVTSHGAVVKKGAFLAFDRPENHMILENAEFKLSWAAIGSTQGHEWFRFALDLLGARVQPENDLNLDENFLTDCYKQWQAMQGGNSGGILTQNSTQLALLPWQTFSPTLRDPQTMRRLCEQLSRLQGLADVYTVRRDACDKSRDLLDTNIPHLGNLTVGYRQYNLRRSSLLRRRGRNRYVNATAEWNPRRYAGFTVA